MVNPAPKPWWASKTVWAGIATVAGAFASAAYAYLGQHDAAAALGELQLAWPGALAIYGRMTATQPIGKDD